MKKVIIISTVLLLFAVVFGARLAYAAATETGPIDPTQNNATISDMDISNIDAPGDPENPEKTKVREDPVRISTKKFTSQIKKIGPQIGSETPPSYMRTGLSFGFDFGQFQMLSFVLRIFGVQQMYFVS